MDVVTANGRIIKQTSEYIEVNGERVNIPDYVKSPNHNRLSVKNGVIKVNGYLFNPDTMTFQEPIHQKAKSFFTRIKDKFLG